jgi:hypothetical protein
MAAKDIRVHAHMCARINRYFATCVVLRGANDNGEDDLASFAPAAFLDVSIDVLCKEQKATADRRSGGAPERKQPLQVFFMSYIHTYIDACVRERECVCVSIHTYMCVCVCVCITNISSSQVSRYSSELAGPQVHMLMVCHETFPRLCLCKMCCSEVLWPASCSYFRTRMASTAPLPCAIVCFHFPGLCAHVYEDRCAML